MPAPAQHIADADAVVRRPEGALREEDDRAAGGAVQSPDTVTAIARNLAGLSRRRMR